MRRNRILTAGDAEHYAVIWDLQWRVVECRRLTRGSDRRGALEATIVRLALDGWRAESGTQFGFVFLTRAGERRLAAVTARDPFSAAMQTFSPFGAHGP